MSEVLEIAEPSADRARRGGRAGKRASGAAAFDQPAFQQYKRRIQPTNFVSEDELEFDPSGIASGFAGDRRGRSP